MYRLAVANEQLHNYREAQEAFSVLASMFPESMCYKKACVRIQRLEAEALKQSIFVGIFNEK